jgi:HlyD family secretion protein
MKNPAPFIPRRLRICHNLRKAAVRMAVARKSVALISLAAAMLTAFLWLVTGQLASVKVTAEKSQLTDLSPEVFGIGIVEARHTYAVSTVIPGRITRMTVDQGSIVKTAQIVAEIDPVDLDEKLAGSRLMTERFANTVKMAEAQLIEAQSRSKNASSTYARFADLSTRGFVSQEMLDARLHEKTAAGAVLDAATANLAAVRRELEKSRADAQGMGKLRNQTHLSSPVNGIVIARLAEIGTILVPGQTALQIIDPTDLWIRARFDQKLAGLLQVGQQACIVLRSSPKMPLTGRIARIDMISDSVTEERIVNVTFSSSGTPVSLGEQAEVTVRLPVISQARSVAAAAVKRIELQSGVWLLQNERARFRKVETGITTLDGRTQIIEGLTDQDEVIVHSQQALQDGLKVKVVTALPGN